MIGKYKDMIGLIRNTEVKISLVYNYIIYYVIRYKNMSSLYLIYQDIQRVKFITTSSYYSNTFNSNSFFTMRYG